METTFQLKNISNIPGVATCSLDDEEAFQIQQNTCVIIPDENQFLVVSAKPPALGLFKAKLYIKIEENPAIEIIDLQCIGCELNFDVSPTSINFERVIINKCEQKTLHLKNLSLVALNWKVSNIEQVSRKYHIQSAYGYIKPFGSCKVLIDYMSEVPEKVPKSFLEIEVFDDFCKNVSLATNYVELLAESCELLINCDPHIIFGQVKSSNTYTYKLEFTNNGKYPLFLDLEEVEREGLKKKEIKILESFQVNTKSINLPVGKMVSVFMSFNPKKEIVLKDFPVFKCVVFDQIQKQKVVLQEFFVTVDAETFFSR